MTLALSIPLLPCSVIAHGYLGSGGLPHERCVQTTFRPGYSNVAICVSEMFDLPSFCTRMPPSDEIRVGQRRSSIQRTVSSMWMHMSPMMPLPYSVNVRHQRRCGTSALLWFGFGGES